MGNILNVKQAYTQTEWEARENYYVKEISGIVIPTTPTSRDIMQITADVDSLLSEVLLEQAYVTRKFEDLEMKMKLSEREVFSIIKGDGGIATNGTVANPNSKLTEADVKGMIVIYLKKNPLPNFKVDIYTLVQATQPRKSFIDAVAKMLVEKKGALLSDLSMIKLEGNIGGGGSSHNRTSSQNGED